MKKVTSLFLVLICCLSMSIPAFAAEDTPTIERLPYNGDAGERIAVDSGEVVILEEPVLDSENEGTELYEIRPSAGIAEVIAYPLVEDIDDPDYKFYYPNIGMIITFNSISQYNDINLTSAEVKGLYSDTFYTLANNIPTEGHSYRIAGWIVETLVQLRAEKPLYLDWRVQEPNFGDGTDYSRLNVTSSIISARLRGPCEFPANTDVSTTTRFNIKGIYGLFYFRNPSGQTLGIPFGAGISLNVDA